MVSNGGFILKMTIDKLFEEMNEHLCYDLMGELVLGDDKIIWTYDINKDIDIIDHDGISEDDVKIISIEEKLQEAYYHDIDLVQNNLSLLDNRDRWYFTEPLLNYCTIVSEFFLIE